MNIYQIKEQYMKLQALAESGEFDQEAIQEAIEMIDDTAEGKAESYGLVMKNLESNVLGLEAEIERLSNLKKSVQSNIDFMKSNLSELLIAAKKEKFKTEHFSFSFRKSESVNVIDVKKIPEKYIDKVTVKTPVKKAIKKAIKEGEKVPGAEIVSKKNLQIK